LANRVRIRTAEADGEAGTGLIGTAFGVVVFLLFLLLGVQVLLGLYTTTVVTSATLDAGDHQLKVEYYEHGGGAYVNVALQIIPVAPPTRGSTWCPARRMCVNIISGTRLPACRLAAVGSKPL